MHNFEVLLKDMERFPKSSNSLNCMLCSSLTLHILNNSIMAECLNKKCNQAREKEVLEYFLSFHKDQLDMNEKLVNKILL